MSVCVLTTDHVVANNVCLGGLLSAKFESLKTEIQNASSLLHSAVSHCIAILPFTFVEATCGNLSTRLLRLFCRKLSEEKVKLQSKLTSEAESMEQYREVLEKVHAS